MLGFTQQSGNGRAVALTWVAPLTVSSFLSPFMIERKLDELLYLQSLCA